TQGTLAANLGATVAAAPDGADLAAEGGVRLENFGLVDGVNQDELAGFVSLTLGGLKVATRPRLAVTLEEVSLAGPYARIRVHPDRTLNLAQVARVPSPAAAPAPASGAAGPAPRIEIGKVVIAGGDFSLADRSVEPNVRLAVSQFGGSITGLSSENPGRGEVDLRARVDGTGPIVITGKLDPLGAAKHVDLRLDFKHIDLLPLSPYSGKYAGYELARGQLGLDVKFRLDGRQVDAANVITLDQFTFGAPVASPDATALPVRLGVALLKDTDGRIVIDVPVQGSYDDPSFRVGRVVLRVVVNLLTKAAVSPFALLGSMFGGGGEELAFQEFAPGASELQPAESAKLATLVKALAGRPGLSLAIEGGSDPAADAFALRRARLAAMVRGRVWAERHAADPNLPPPEKLEITPEAQAVMVRRMFDEKFPPGTEFGAPLPPAPKVTAPPPVPKKGILARVVAALTGEGQAAPGPGVPAAPAGAAGSAEAAGPSLEEMTGRLAEAIAVNDNDLRELAAARAGRVRDYFVTEGKISAERLFLTQGGDAAKARPGPRVYLSLQ
ncbi:MAG: DUF748 domain-containing protein, partial [Opitutaceae bacterium]|nr:DUF748 domain-containing protein [Opitutaceae bacterium]